MQANQILPHAVFQMLLYFSGVLHLGTDMSEKRSAQIVASKMETCYCKNIVWHSSTSLKITITSVIV